MSNLPPVSTTSLERLKIQAQQLEIAYGMAEKLCQTELVPQQYRNKPMDAAVAIQWGLEVGISATQALQNIAVIRGIPTMWGDMVVAIVQGSGLCEELDVSYDPTTHTATATTKRKGREPKSYSYSLAHAQQAGLVKQDGAWHKHPQRMAENRARGWLLRNEYADLIKGFEVHEIAIDDWGDPQEKDVTPKNHALTKSNTLNSFLESIPKSQIQSELDDKILEATSVNELKEVGELISLTDNETMRDALRVTYTERLKQLKKLKEPKDGVNE